jgi:adenylosuccinate synthase
MIKEVHVTVGVSWGDEGKGAVVHHLCKEIKPDVVMRYNGGGNAGHTIYHEGKKFVTHYIPAGVFYKDTYSLIGPGCVVDPAAFLKEVQYLKDNGLDFDEKKIKIARNVHLINEAYKIEDAKDESIGTTKTGNGPAYRNKYNRSGKTLEMAVESQLYPEFADHMVDIYEFLHGTESELVVLCEGAQGFNLDIDWGRYPYVTSSHCSTAGALLNGLPFNKIKSVWGVGKAYDTYVGKDQFQPEGEIFEKIQEVGQEFGATTGRKRQVNFLNLDLLKRACLFNGVTHLVLNKLDILENVPDSLCLYHNDSLLEFDSSNEFCVYIQNVLWKEVSDDMNIQFSRTPHGI